MNKNLRLLMLAGVALALFSSVGCNKLRARDQLNKGVQSYKNSKYEEAINHFQQAVELDPSLLNARMYLMISWTCASLKLAPKAGMAPFLPFLMRFWR